MGYLASIERSLNTIKAYAHDLKDWFVYLGGVGLDWREVSLEDVAGFVGWLRLPPAARDGWVAVLPTVEHYCSESSVNRKLAALTSFCELHARHGVALAGLLVGLTLQVRAGPRWRPDPDDPVLGRRPCTVVGCDRSRTAFGLCSGHDQRWRTRGCPDLAEFNADPGPTINGRRELTHCTVPECRYGSGGFGLCTRHRLVWFREGQPDSKPWAAQASLVGPSTIAECLLPFCSVWTEDPKHQFCKSHETRWAQLGRPDAEEYIAHCLRSGKARIDFRGMAPQLTLQRQYAVQCRQDQATITAPPPVVAWTIALARRAEVSSLLDLPSERWHELAGSKQGMYQRFLEYARDAVETLHEGTSWEVEYPRDVWRLHRLPGLTLNAGKTPHSRINLRFDRFTQPWLATLAKRWARLRLSSGLTVATVLCDIQGLTR